MKIPRTGFFFSPSDGEGESPALLLQAKNSSESQPAAGKKKKRSEEEMMKDSLRYTRRYQGRL